MTITEANSRIFVFSFPRCHNYIQRACLQFQTHLNFHVRNSHACAYNPTLELASRDTNGNGLQDRQVEQEIRTKTCVHKSDGKCHFNADAQHRVLLFSDKPIVILLSPLLLELWPNNSSRARMRQRGNGA